MENIKSPQKFIEIAEVYHSIHPNLVYLREPMEEMDVEVVGYRLPERESKTLRQGVPLQVRLVLLRIQILPVRELKNIPMKLQ